MRRLIYTATVLAVALMSSTGHTYPLDTVSYRGGPVLSPRILCLMWSGPGNPYTSSEVTQVQDYLTGMTNYFANAANGNGSNGAGSEPVPRQYGVWGASFDGKCVTDTTNIPTCGASPFDPGCTTGLMNVWDDSASSGSIAMEIQNGPLKTAYPNGVFDGNTIVVVFTRGWPYDPQQGTGFANHNSLGAGKYVAVIPTDIGQDYTIVSHELIEAATDPVVGGAWYTNQIAGCTVGGEVCDGGTATEHATLKVPLSDGFGNQTHQFAISNSVDNIGGSATFSCPDFAGLTCAPVGNVDQCSQSAQPPVPVVYDGDAFTKVTTTPPVAVAFASGFINVVARTTSGFVHLRGTGSSFTQVTPPGGSASETPALVATNSTSMTMFGRGYDGALKRWTYSGSAWSGPTNLGGQVNGPVSAAVATISGTVTTAAVMLTPARQISAFKNGVWSTVTLPPNVSAMSPPQLFSTGSCFDLYFTGSDGAVYRQACWPSGTWTANPSTAAAFGLVTEAAAAGDTQRTAVYNQPVGLGGSQTWFARYNGSTLVNSALLPTATTIGPVSGAALSGAIALFANNGGSIQLSTFNGTSASSWSSALGTANSPPVAFSSGGPSWWVFARGASGNALNHLLFWTFNGTSTSGFDTGVSIM